MARLTRLTFAGHAHLLLVRAAPGSTLFVDDIDRRQFLDALRIASQAVAVAIHAYSLLDGQIALLATPEHDHGIERLMQRLGRRHAASFNARHRRSGPLWHGRYAVAAIDAATHGWLAIQWIELAPVRARRVAQAQEWPWSSAGHHTGGVRSAWLREHALHWTLGNTPFEREARHALRLTDEPSSESLDRMASQVARGWPIGSPAFVAGLEALALRPLAPRARGRPHRHPDAGTDAPKR